MEIREIQISKIKEKENIRQYEFELNEIMRSIKDNGLLQPIGVKEEEDGFYTIIWGHRRLNACKKLGWRNIPAVIFLTKDQELTEEDFFVLNATENLQRRDNNLKEFGRICKILRRTMSKSEISARLGVPTSRVNSALSEIDRIPVKWQKKIRLMNGEKNKEGDIPLSTASKVIAFTGLTPVQKDALLEEVSKNDIPYVTTSYIAGFMRRGLTAKESIKKLNEYKLIQVKCLVKRKDFEDFMTKYESTTDFVVDSFNKATNDNSFAVKIGMNYEKKQ